MPLGTMVGLGPGTIVIDANPASPPPKGTAPKFRPVSIVAKRIKVPLGVKVVLGPGRIVLREDPAPLPKGADPSNFWPMSIVANRSPIYC